MRGTHRRGALYRIFKPEWADPLDTTYSQQFGGRWNAPRSFGALYLNGSIEVAAANARHQHRGRAIGLFDLKPDRRPHLLTVEIPQSLLLDVVRSDEIRVLGLPANYPFNVGCAQCRPIGKRAYTEKRFCGVACRSAAECTESDWLGEEVAWFDRAPALHQSVEALPFVRWYPDLKP